MARQFGKLYPETVSIAISDSIRVPSWLRAFLWLTPFFKDGKALEGEDCRLLEEWIHEYSSNVNIAEVQTVSFSLQELTDGLYKGTKGSAQNAIKGMVSHGLIERVSKGVKGRSSLFVILPLPLEKPP